MKTIFNHIERIREQPHHVRKQVAFASAAVGTALIALVWLAGSIGTGTFALKGDSAAGQEAAAAVAGTGAEIQNLAGAGAALPRSEDSPAYIEIIDSSPAATGKKQAEQTTLPF